MKNEAIIKNSIELGTNVDYPDEPDYTNNFFLIEYLIEYGTNVNLLSYIKHLLNFEFYEASVLMIECKNGSEDTIKCRL
ncbi:hypothetical protein H8356DRAFT_1328035 [Neocallimastix lanati (nom. inval.)]|nr:hypothetical protein H8356DRAFT_1328035 [Neocallimastix sp. JGI-2020a]